MSVSGGFFNSLNGDRKYDSRAFSSMFNNLIIDGVFASYGTAFVVKSVGGLSLTVGIGRAWFNSSYLLNDAILPMDATEADLIRDRIDAVIIEINNTEAVRECSIKYITGDPSTSPVNPVLIKEGDVYQYPLCYIYRAAGSTAITQAEITNMVGTEETPFVTGILQTISLDELLGQWQAELDQFVANESNEIDEWSEEKKTEMVAWFEQLKSELLLEQQTLDQWVASEQEDFLAWYQTMKDQLSEDAAGHLQLEIDREEVNRILLNGFADGSKVFSDDGTVITSTAADGRTLTKTFTNNFLTMTVVLKSATGGDVATMVKNFDSTGKTIDIVTTYV